MQCMLLGYSFKPRPNSHVLGTAGSVMHQFNNKWLLTFEKKRLARDNKIDLGPEVWAAVPSTGWQNSGRASLSSHSRRQKEAWLAGCLLWYPTIMKNYKPAHYNVCISLEFLLWLLLFWALHCNNFSFHFLIYFCSFIYFSIGEDNKEETRAIKGTGSRLSACSLIKLLLSNLLLILSLNNPTLMYLSNLRVY